MARATIRAVAERAGVSTMTVSRVLRGEGDSQYEAQVLEAVRELDYVPVRSALQNRHVKTNSIGVLLDGEFVFETYIGLKTFQGVAQEAFKAGFDLLMLQPKEHQPLEKQKLQFLDRRCDGFIFVVPFEQPEILDLLITHKFPAVTCYSNDVPEGIGWVIPDNEAAVRQAIQLLLDKGHRRIGFWSSGYQHSDSRHRLETYEEVMKEAGLGIILWPTHDQRSSAYRAEEIMAEAQAQQVTAIVCHNDERAVLLWEAALKQGLKVPEDISLIGIDDMPFAAERGLTTFANGFYEVGTTAVAALISLLRGGDVASSRRRLPMPIRERVSVAPPPRHSTVMPTQKH